MLFLEVSQPWRVDEFIFSKLKRLSLVVHSLPEGIISQVYHIKESGIFPQDIESVKITDKI